MRIELKIIPGEHDRPGAISAVDVQREVKWLREAGHTYVAAMLERLWAALHPAPDLVAAADALLFASRIANGSGSTYVADIQGVIDAVAAVPKQPGALTDATHRQVMQEHTSQVTASLDDLRLTLKTCIGALRREIDLQGRSAA